MASSLGALHKPSPAAVLDVLERDAAAIARRMAAAARAEVDEYGAVTDPAFAAEVLDHAAEHVRAFVRTGRLGRPPEGADLDFVRARGVRRARELMPLDALLETYLIGQRTVWEAIVDAAGDTPAGMRAAQQLTAHTFRYTHAINVAIAEAYLAESTALASEVERGRRDLLERLLSGRTPGSEEERRAETLGLRPGAEHAVVVATTVADENARLVARALATEMPFVVPRHGEVVGLAPVYVRRGPRELRAALERRAQALARTHGVELRAGVSTTRAGLAEIARGYGEAQRALRGHGGVVAVEEIPLLDYLTDGADETARRLIPGGVEALGDVLAETLRAYANCDLNVARTAQRLAVHANTVHYRLGRAREVTGRDPRRFAELTELLTALRLLDS